MKNVYVTLNSFSASTNKNPLTLARNFVFDRDRKRMKIQCICVREKDSIHERTTNLSECFVFKYISEFYLKYPQCE